MFELSPENITRYLSTLQMSGPPDGTRSGPVAGGVSCVSRAGAALRGQAGIPAGPWEVEPLGGGVSNRVLLVRTPQTRFVVKQSLGQLRVEEEWFADRSRIHRESAAMAALAPHLPPNSVPAVLFEDNENCIYAMEAAPASAADWKSQLLSGRTDVKVARKAAGIHAAMIDASWCSEAWDGQFGDQTCFGQLRLDPYYRFAASKHPRLADVFAQCIQACQTRRQSLVHGDFSPKNLLVWEGQVMVIDFEVIHYGDPSFDAAFLLNHLLLKAVHRPHQATEFAELASVYWRALRDAFPGSQDEFEYWTIRHLGCLHLARVDGKSPAEYLTPAQRGLVRQRALGMIQSPPRQVEEIFDDHR
ncbi:MAG: aminoglycoside phosphotransferase family protein [Acidobacteriia bacterium]|nr:aminoglycoside phosphotransferase family protein [Terriglobia bacterium]